LNNSHSKTHGFEWHCGPRAKCEGMGFNCEFRFLQSENKVVVRADVVQQAKSASSGNRGRGRAKLCQLVCKDAGHVSQSAVCATVFFAVKTKVQRSADCTTREAPLLDRNRACTGKKLLVHRGPYLWCAALWNKLDTTVQNCPVLPQL